jgi:hypothetical protein
MLHVFTYNKRYTNFAKYFEGKNNSIGLTFDNPMKIKITQGLNDELFLPDTLAYQMRYVDNKIFIGPVIGLLLGNHIQLYHPAHMEKFSDRFGIYDKIGGLICAFTPKSINWNKKIVYGTYCNSKNSK